MFGFLDFSEFSDILSKFGKPLVSDNHPSLRSRWERLCYENRVTILGECLCRPPMIIHYTYTDYPCRVAVREL